MLGASLSQRVSEIKLTIIGSCLHKPTSSIYHNYFLDKVFISRYTLYIMETTYTHYISTGAQEVYYTLRVRWQETLRLRSGEVVLVDRDHHIQNLSLDVIEATRKAKELTGENLTPGFIPQGTRSTNSTIDFSILRGGKYEGESIYTLAGTTEGKKYLLWFAENLAKSPTHAKTVVLLQALLAADLKVRQDARDAEAVAREETSVKRIQFCEDLGILATLEVSGDWAASVSSDIRSGGTVSDRCADIIINILAKKVGRGGSKKYQVEEDRLIGLGIIEILTGKV
jgi:hypothetical protein